MNRTLFFVLLAGCGEAHLSGPEPLVLDADVPTVTVDPVHSPVDADLMLRGTVSGTHRPVRAVVVGSRAATADAFNFATWSVSWTLDELRQLGTDEDGRLELCATVDLVFDDAPQPVCTQFTLAEEDTGGSPTDTAAPQSDTAAGTGT